MYLNKVFLIGNLTRDPELKSLPSGTNVAQFSVATNRTYKDKEGNSKDQTEFHNIVVFGRQAETTAQYLRKGSSALIEGRIQTRSWDGPDGGKRYRTEIVADRVQFGPRKFEGGGTPANASGKKEKTTPQEEKIDTIDYPEEEINPEDIPF
jgi:single-strand DNA-binding protein